MTPIKLSKEERRNRIIAFGEFSDHCHVVTGNAKVYQKNDKTFIEVPEDAEAQLEHLLESAWNKGEIVPIHTKEQGRDGHLPIDLKKGTYEYVAQEEYDPFAKQLRKVMD